MRRSRINPKNIYFVQRGTDGPIKIGMTSGDPGTRVRELQVASPEKLHLLGCVRGIESDIHGRFARHHISGEWFHPHSDILKFVRSNDTPHIGHRVNDCTVSVRLPARLVIALERESARMSRVTGVKASVSDVVRSVLRNKYSRRSRAA